MAGWPVGWLVGWSGVDKKCFRAPPNEVERRTRRCFWNGKVFRLNGEILLSRTGNLFFAATGDILSRTGKCAGLNGDFLLVAD